MDPISKQPIGCEPEITLHPRRRERLDDIYSSRVFIRAGRNRKTGNLVLACLDLTGKRRRWHFMGPTSSDEFRVHFLVWLKKLQAQLEEAGELWERIDLPGNATAERNVRANLKRRLTEIARERDGEPPSDPPRGGRLHPWGYFITAPTVVGAKKENDGKDQAVAENLEIRTNDARERRGNM